MPALVLQNPSKKSKARKVHLSALERRMKLWKDCSLKLWEESNINEVLQENSPIQDRLPSNIKQMNIEKFCLNFSD